MNVPRYYLVDSPDRLRRVLAHVAAMPVSKARPIEVVVREPRREKSGDQRRLFHAVCADIALELGLTPGQVKDAIKVDFYGEETFIINGVRYAHVQSTEDSDREEYSRLIDHAYQWSAENGVVIPDRRKPKHNQEGSKT